MINNTKPAGATFNIIVVTSVIILFGGLILVPTDEQAEGLDNSVIAVSNIFDSMEFNTSSSLAMLSPNVTISSGPSVSSWGEGRLMFSY